MSKSEAVLGSRLRLGVLAALTLFVELALIRWCSANVIYLGYFSNFILLACFLGIGVGFLVARRDWDLFRYAPASMFAVMAFVLMAQSEIQLPDFSERVYFGFEKVSDPFLPAWMTLSLLFCGIAALFVCICQETGRCFAKHEALKAYNIDIIGSMLGIVAFTGMSFLNAPAWSWFLVAASTLVWLFRDRYQSQIVRAAAFAGIGCVAIAVLSQMNLGTDDATWSPYQLVGVSQESEGGPLQYVSVNRIPHQTMFPVDREVGVYTTTYDIAEEYGVGDFERALIIGAGSGTDVAYALENGVDHVDAVEIDPVIADYGRRLHIDRPYDDPRVDLIIDDGRNILEKAEGEYDLIIFALPDSLAALSSHSSVRLESFLFTTESIAAARDALAPGGMLVLYNYYRTERIVGRLAGLMHQAFGRWPDMRRLDSVGLSVLAIGDEVGSAQAPASIETELEPLPTDDWPFLYMNEPTIPTHYLIPLGLILLLSMILVVVAGPKSSIRSYHATFFFMGAAFLLLETKSIVQFSLLFGATWLTNSLVFFAVLAMVLAANLLVMYRRPRRVWPLYVVLAASLFIGWYVSSAQLAAFDPAWARYVVASLVVFSPIFLANLIFSSTFVGSESPDASFGWNLMGAMLGGVVEYASLALGYRNLAIVVAGFYVLAFLAYWAWSRRRV